MSIRTQTSPSMFFKRGGAIHRLREEGLSLVLTGRGWMVLLFTTYLILFPVLEQSDIVAAMLGFFLLVILVLMAVVTLALAFKLRRDFDAKISQPEQIFSQSGPQFMHIHLEPFSLPLLWRMSLKLEFARSGLNSACHVLTGKCTQASVLAEKILFPHRGVWRAVNLRISVSDHFSLTRVVWNKRLSARDGTLRVSPPERQTPLLPIISSSSREGDLVNDIQSRAGDPFDLKRYHPADGMRRILWKVFARTGELITRHPEPSVNPEGQVVLFVMAQPNDDELCSRAIAYVKMLEDLDLGVFAACRGQSSRPIARTSQALQTILIDSAWDSKCSDAQSIVDLGKLITEHANQSRGSNLQKILIFISESQIHEEAHVLGLTRFGMHLSENQIQPVFCVYCGAISQHTKTLPSKQSLTRIVKGILIHSTESSTTPTPASRTKFFEIAQRFNWLIIQCS